MFWYRASARTRLLASRADRGSSPRNSPGWTVSSGRKVARPAFSRRSRAMPALAAASFPPRCSAWRPEGGLHCQLAPGLHRQNGGHRPDDAPQPAAGRGLHHRPDRVLVALHVLFQLLQNGQPLGGGVPGAVQLRLGGGRCVQGLFAVGQFQGQPGPDVGQLPLAARQHIQILAGIGEVCLQLGQAGLLGLGPGPDFGQAAPGRSGGGAGRGLLHPGGRLPAGGAGEVCAQFGLPGAGGVGAALQLGQLAFQRLDLCGEGGGLAVHLGGRGFLAFQLGGRGLPVGLALGQLVLQGAGALAGVVPVVFQHGDAAVGCR